MQIITVTLNPAFDVHCTTERFLPYRENIFDVSARDAGGKGVNVSRALLSNGVESLAVCAVGRENGAEFLQALRSEGLTVAAVAVEGRIRENITLHEKENPETRISFSGFSMNEAALADKIHVVHDGKIAFSGTPSEVFSNREMLMECSLEPPQSAMLTQLLSEYIDKDAPCAINSEIAVSVLEEALKKHGINPRKVDKNA